MSSAITTSTRARTGTPCISGADPGQRSAPARRADRAGHRASRHRHHGLDLLRAPLHLRAAPSRPPTITRRAASAGTSSPRISRAVRAISGRMGLKRHDNRYEVAAEYVEVLYKLFEGSWEDGAVLRGPGPADLHRPGQSPRDRPSRSALHGAGLPSVRALAAGARRCSIRRALRGPARPSRPPMPSVCSSPRAAQTDAQGIRGRRARPGTGCRPLAPRRADLQPHHDHRRRDRRGRAQKKFEEYQSYASYDGALVFMSGWSGIDFGQYAPTDLIRKVETNAIVSMVEHFSSFESPGRSRNRPLGGIGGIGPVFVGSPATVADILQEWVADTDVDGFNLAYAVTPESFEDAVNLLVPELQRRGVYPKAYRPGTLREKLFGLGPTLRRDPSGPRFSQHRSREGARGGAPPRRRSRGRVRGPRVRPRTRRRAIRRRPNPPSLEGCETDDPVEPRAITRPGRERRAPGCRHGGRTLAPRTRCPRRAAEPPLRGPRSPVPADLRPHPAGPPPPARSSGCCPTMRSGS